MGCSPCFNDDFGVTTGSGETFGLSVFFREGDDVGRTYFTAGRGVEPLGRVWTFLDLTPLGRQEQWEDSPSVPADPAVHVVASPRRVLALQPEKRREERSCTK